MCDKSSNTVLSVGEMLDDDWFQKILKNATAIMLEVMIRAGTLRSGSTVLTSAAWIILIKRSYEP